MPPKVVCSKCFNIVQKDNLIKCNICHLIYHSVCANINSETDYNVIKNNKNILFSCDNCLMSSSDLLRSISHLANELKNVKLMVIELTKKVSNNNVYQESHNSAISVNKENTSHNINSNNIENLLGSGNSFSSSENPCTLPNEGFIAEGVAESQSISSIHHTCSENSISHNNVAVAESQTGLIANEINSHTKHAYINVHASTSRNGAVNELPTTSNTVAGNNNNNVNREPEWVNAINKKNKNKKKKRNIVVGQSDNDELEVIVRRKFVHLSSFKPSVTEEQIISYVKKHLNVVNDHIVCFKLVKKDTDLNSLKRINFKLGVSPDIFSQLFKSSLWPSSVTVRPFQNFQKKPIDQALT